MRRKKADMEKFDCPDPKTIQRAIEIRQEVRDVTFVASWPAAAISSAAAILSVLAAIVAHRARVDTFLFYLVLLGLLALPIAFSQWIGNKVLHVETSRFSARPTGSYLPWWGYLLAAIVVVPISYFLAGGREMPTVVTSMWLWLGTAGIAGGWMTRRGDQILAGALWLVCGGLYVRTYPEGGNLYDVFVFSLSFAAIAEAALAYWARRKWQKNAARFQSILT